MRERRRIIGAPSHPLGLQAEPALTLSRRTFVGVALSTPLSVAVATAAPKAPPPHSDPLDVVDLRFFEAAGAMTVAAYRCDVRIAEWRLPALAFGPDANFRLRTLKSGADKLGYELLVQKVQCGAVKDRHHYFTFLRHSAGWRVRMRSDLWSPEVTSDAVDFGPICLPPLPAGDNCKTLEKEKEAHPQKVFDVEPPKVCLPSFCFNVSGAPIASTLGAIFRGHIESTGSLQLVFDQDCVWSVAPQSGRLLVVPYGIDLRNLELSWCEPPSPAAPSKAHALLQGALPEGTAALNRDGAASVRPVFCAGGEIDDQQGFAINFSGDGSVRGSLERTSNLSFAYLSEEWRSTAGDPPVAAATLSGDWTLETRHGGRVMLGRISLDADLVTRRNDCAVSTFHVELNGMISPQPAQVDSRIGRLRIKGWDFAQSQVAAADQIPSEPDTAQTQTPPTGAKRAKDRPGMHLLLSYSASGKQASLHSMDVPFLLLESDLALLGADLSSLTFAPTLVNAFYRSDKKLATAAFRSPGNFLWLGSRDSLPGGQLLRLDLARARLQAARCDDLLSLAFMFSGFFLIIDFHGIRLESGIQLCLAETRRVTTQPQEFPQPLDTRPILVVEFPPQHLFEQALFRPSLPGLPDVVLVKEGENASEEAYHFSIPADRFRDKTGGGLPVTAGAVKVSIRPEELVRTLARLEEPDDRTLVRSEYANLKKNLESKNNGGKLGAFAHFSDQFAKAFDEPFKLEKSIADQKVYIGPYGMDPDVAATARDTLQGLVNTLVEDQLTAALQDADQYVGFLVSDKPPTNTILKYIKDKFDSFVSLVQRALSSAEKLVPTSTASATQSCDDTTLFRETVVSKVVPDFEYFRDFYRQQMIELSVSNRPVDREKFNVGIVTSSTCDLEYFSPSNRGWADAEFARKLAAREAYVKENYMEVLSGKDKVPPSARVRLANPTRLAFRVRCNEQDTSARLPGIFYSAHRLRFELAALTEWSQYELAVTPRARAIGPFNEAGQPLNDASSMAVKSEGTEAAENSAPSGGDSEMLRSLGIRGGRYITAEDRLADVEAALRAAPTSLETAIEIPARLILSPSQRAVWRTPRSMVAATADCVLSASRSHYAPTLLWNAALAIELQAPGLRAVHSPDLRPGFVRRGFDRLARSAKPSHSAMSAVPPHGPRAPWTLGVDEGDPSASPATEVANALGAYADTHPLVKYLRTHEANLALYQTSDTAVFRSSLDAYDRHELVILSSAWGLPVRGKREENGKLQPTNTSSQVEPSEEYSVINLESGSALYRPRALKVQELRLTALGGTFRHDTDFVPPSQARDIEHRDLFDALSIERWQHWVVLGRDIFAEVVYKGYLFPLGHRASLIKQTERIFIKSMDAQGKPRGSVRAFLRQRMFIRVGSPTKTFPALGQPNLGRQFPAKSVRILTINTPDIVDPAQDFSTPGAKTNDEDAFQPPRAPLPGGRLFASAGGLVFWPRTARISGAEVRFDVLIDNSFVRMALMFVDNTAVNNARLLAAVVQYYNTNLSSPDTPPETTTAAEAVLSEVRPDKQLRAIDFSSQSHRYCDELKPGSATHKTVSWVLKASGCAIPRSLDISAPPSRTIDGSFEWEGANTVYDDPSLEGADQPPFYPALETARIRLDQVERMTGQSSQVALVQFDGFYASMGFAKSSNSTNTTDWRDPVEIYLSILNDVSYSMGRSGERSGGLFRPESKLVALSRQRGPLGGPVNDTRQWTGKLFTRAGQYSGGVLAGRQDPDRVPTDAEKLATRDDFRSYFPAPSAPNKPGSGGLDAKILGLVTIHELVEFVTLSSGAQGLPVLHELVQYSVVGQAGADFIRTQVIEPLDKLIVQLKAQWNSLSTQMQNKTAALRGLAELSIADVFPEIDQGLTDLQKSLAHSAATSGEVAFYSSLAEVYESGRRLLDALGQASANPLERLYLAVANKAQELFHEFQDFSQKLLSDLNDQVKTDLKRLTSALISLLAHTDSLDAPILRARFLPLPPDARVDEALTDALTQAFNAVVDGKKSAQAWEEFKSNIKSRAVQQYQPLEDALTPVLAAVSALQNGVKGHLNDLASGTDQLLQMFFPNATPTVQFTDILSLNKELWNVLTRTLDTVSGTAHGTTNLMGHLADLSSLFQGLNLQGVPGPARTAIVTLTTAVTSKKRDLEQAAQRLVQRKLNVGDIEQNNLVDVRFYEMSAALDQLAAVFEQLDALLPPLLSDPRLLHELSPELDKKIGQVVSVLVRDILLLQKQCLSWRRPLQRILNSSDSLLRAVASYETRLDTALEDAGKLPETWSLWARDQAALLPTPGWTDLQDIGEDAMVYFARRLGGQLLEWRSALLDVAFKQETTLLTGVAKTVQPALQAVADAYRTLVEARRGLYESLSTKFPALASVLFIPKPGQASNAVSLKDDQLVADQAMLESLADTAAKDVSDSKQLNIWLSDATHYRSLSDFLQSWAHGTATPVAILNKILKLTLEDVRTQLLGMIDFSAFRQELDALIRQLIPASSTLTYDFKLPLDDRAGQATHGIFMPHQGCELIISSNTTVNLLNPSVSFTSKGTLGPFDIVLVGSAFNAVTITFAGATFGSTGGETHCDVRYIDFKIGPALKFVEQLGKFFKPKQGSGFFLVPLSGGIGIEAGYGLNIGTISLGNVSFFNISLNASVRLPFDGKKATFVSSLSRRDAPFTISVAPYGGSGFFAIEASARGIIGFEASFEYGGAGAFSYGPLSGQGRLMIGIYIRQKRNDQDQTETDIAATFFAGGSAAIWIFSFSASLYVCATMHGDTMVGDATFTFSFSMGLVDFDYRVNVHKEMHWGGGGRQQSSQNTRRPRELFDSADPDTQLTAQIAEHRSDTWGQGEHWGRHLEYSDFSIHHDVEEFV